MSDKKTILWLIVGAIVFGAVSAWMAYTINGIYIRIK